MPTTTTVNVSTSVVLIDTSQSNAPYYVDFPNISTVGRLITVRDNAGYASLLNGIVLRPIGGATFNTAGNIEIDQPFGFVTLTSADSGRYNILNTFAFPAGQAVANISNLNASNIAVTNNITASTLSVYDVISLQDKVSTGFYNTLTSSNNNFYLNYSTILGNITTSTLNSTVIGLGSAGYISTIVPVAPITDQQYVAVGFTRSTILSNYVAKGTIITGVTGELWADATFGPSQGFSGGGLDVASGNDLFVAVGSGVPTSPGLNYIQYSREGSNWSNATLSLTADDIKQRVIYGANKYIATGYSNGSAGGLGTIICSPDGANWSPAATGGFNLGYGTGLSYALGVYVATGVQLGGPIGQCIQWTTDGSNWNSAASIAWNSSSAWDVTFNGTQFIALVGRTPNNNRICLSGNGSNWTEAGVSGALFPVDSNFGGYIAANQSIVLVTSSNNAPSGQMMYYSLNGGFSWQVNPTWASGQLGRPYWDGGQWWVGYYNPADSNQSGMYYSANGIAWTNAGQTNFYGGLMRGIALRSGALNLGPLLVSTVAGLQSSFTTQTLATNTISAGQIAVSSLTVTSDLSLSTVTIRSLTASTISMPNINITATSSTTPVSIGFGAGLNAQQNGAVAVGINAGSNTQGLMSVAIGSNTAFQTQGASAVAIGPNSGQNSQGTFGVAIGNAAGSNNQATLAIAMGSAAGFETQGQNGIAIGQSAGRSNQGTFAVGLGTQAGQTSQGSAAVSIGIRAGFTTQGAGAIAIGSNAGSNTQGANSIAIGTNAGLTNMSTQTIVLNATGSALNTAGSNRTYIAPIRQNAFTTETGFVLGYTTSNEICQTSNNTISLSNGRVGINRINPAALLDVFGTAVLQTSTLFGGTNAGLPQVIQITPGVSPVSGRLTFGGDNSGWQFRIGQNNAGTITDIITINDGGGNFNNVGINTTSPAYGLDVVGKRDQVARFRSSIGSQEITMNADTNWTNMVFNSSNDVSFVQGVGTGASGALLKDMYEFYTYLSPGFPGGTSRRVYQISTSADVRFNSNVGFGTWPSSSNRVDINGNLNVFGATLGSAFIMNSNGYYRGVSESQYMTVGTSWPIAMTNTSTGMYVNRANTNLTDLYFRVLSNTTVITPLVVANDGQVGIGTTSPSYGLDVVATTNVIAQFRSSIASQSLKIQGDVNGLTLDFSSSNNASFRHILGTGAGGGVAKDMYEFYTYPAPSATPARQVYQVSTSADVRFNSNVGIKTWPASGVTLDVAGTIRGSSTIVRVVNQRVGSGAGSVSVASGASTHVITVNYTPVQTGNVSTLVFASVSANFNGGSGTEVYQAFLTPPNSGDSDYYSLALIGQAFNTEGSRTVTYPHNFQTTCGQNGVGTYRLTLSNVPGGGDALLVYNQTTLTIMELSQT